MAASMSDATSDSEFEALKNLTDVADIENALKNLNKQEVCFVLTQSYS